MSNRIETSITQANGGIHNVARYRVARKMILENKYKKARLYHFILTGSDNQQAYRKAADGIARLLRDNNIPCCGKGCFEVDEDKGMHFHFMVLLDAGSGGRVDYWLNVAEDGPLKTMLKRFDVQVHIAKPKNDMHRVGGNKLGKMPLYAYVSKRGPKLEDALVRISYLYKKRSKDDSMTRIYYSTRERVKKEAQPAVEASDATTTTINENEEEMTNQLTPAGFKYLASLYEACIDRGMHLGEIKDHLHQKGVTVSPSQIVYHLDNVFDFHGYAASHPAPPKLTYAELDALEEAKASKRTHILVRADNTKVVDCNSG